MKASRLVKLYFLLILFSINAPLVLTAQDGRIIPPSDVVVSPGFAYDFQQLADPNYNVFGKIETNAQSRKNIITNDVVCASYCKNDPFIGYRPVTKACDYYTNLYDANLPNKLFNLNWGMDGYAENIKSGSLKLNIIDFRKCNLGVIQRHYEGIDNNNNTVKADQFIIIVPCNYINSLSCRSETTISLGDSCCTTITPNMVLIGNPYPCEAYYQVEVRDWITNAVVDRDKNKEGTQLCKQDNGRAFKINIRDQTTGNICWSYGRLIDNIKPILICPKDTTINCSSPSSPKFTGQVEAYDNCEQINISYTDVISRLDCQMGLDKIITRKWTVKDESENKNQCEQIIKIKALGLSTLNLPHNFDNIDLPALRCENKFDSTIDFQAHQIPASSCVDGFLLDSAYWIKNNNKPDVFPLRRIPKIFGWNIINGTDPNIKYHPNPRHVYYSNHKLWKKDANICWNENEYIQWEGTGIPLGQFCSTISSSFTDSIFYPIQKTCKADSLICYGIFRKWFIIDFCSGKTMNHTQIIKIEDTEGPAILYPDSIQVQVSYKDCKGHWLVPKPVLSDNCSNEIHYSIESSTGEISGDEISNYEIKKLDPGFHTINLIATDCSGNKTIKKVIVQVGDYLPPVAICDKETTISINGLLAPGKNITKVYANSNIDPAPTDSCGNILFFKAIRADALMGTIYGSKSDNQVTCNEFYTDADNIASGKQVYFDDYTLYCCEDVNKTIPTLFAIFNVDPGPGPIEPERFNIEPSIPPSNPSYGLKGRFDICTTLVHVKNFSNPVLVAPPHIVVSRDFEFDINKLSNPLDSTFGRIVSDLSNRKKVSTIDIVCHKFCEPDHGIGYPAYDNNTSNNPVQNKACRYYQQLFDTAHQYHKYNMDWGFDGYAISSCVVDVKIEVTDLRTCGSGKILRKIIVEGPDHSIQFTTQTIYILDCSENKMDRINPTANCYSGIINLNFHDSSCVLIQAVTINNGSFDNCSPNEKLLYYFDGNPLQTTKTICCSDFQKAGTKNELKAEFYLWVEDEQGNKDSCLSTINFIDTSNRCITNANRNQDKSSSLSIIPNPSSGTFKVYSDKLLDELRIFSSTGIEVKTIKTKGQHIVPVSGLPAGIYFVESRSGHVKLATTKLIVY